MADTTPAARPATEARPTTTNGLGLLGALRKQRTMPDPEVDWAAWIAAIEAEAAQPLATLRERVPKLPNREVRRNYDGTPWPETVERDAVLALLAAPAAVSGDWYEVHDTATKNNLVDFPTRAEAEAFILGNGTSTLVIHPHVADKPPAARSGESLRSIDKV